MLISIYQKYMPQKFRHYIYLKRIGRYFEERNIIKVYSHPRSGTHFLEAFLAKNLYPNKSLHVANVTWGHWANRLKRENGNEYGLLFGSHNFPGKWIKDIKHPMIYIYRDGRDVAYSVWKTPNFIHPQYKDIPFEEFLSLKLDWEGSPGNKSQPTENIAQHWERHVHEWHKVQANNLLIIRYEELKTKPQKIFETIMKKFYPLRYILYKIFLYRPKIDPINTPIGLKPNQARTQEWLNIFSPEDEMFFLNQVHEKKYLSNQHD